ncbi:CotH kinase family protein [Parapedobacter sp. 10938]|uniref:CotH kinase family protein n=1 Tax=Parapedobacter flavus TaxID=3110225 RepID=UPI002DBAB6CC|nr:CotH kinase family protein [Parapedobacter sp. 10938]MEC3881480.1 CotH kinase family protein [Parapedobacter sp. 10938]
MMIKKLQASVHIPLMALSVLSFLFVSCEKEKLAPKIFADTEIGKLPDRLVFKLGETPDFTGLEISEVYTDSTRKPTPHFKTEWTGDIFKKGTSNVTVRARDREATFQITFSDELVETGLPVLYIDTENEKAVDSKDDYVNANMVVKNAGEIVSENALRIKGRGNATWTYEKKPYKLKLDSKAPMLGMEEAKDWILLANYCDKTLLRTSIAFELSRLMGFPWTPDDRFVEVVLNGEYLGNYQLTEAIEQGSNRIDIPKTGFVFERDGYYEQEPKYFVSASRGYGYSFKNPDPEDELSDDQWHYIKNYVDAFESVLASETFADPQHGYPSYIDVSSFARWFIFQNILANMDTNVYLIKEDANDAKLSMGPVWDFEWSIGIGWYDGVRPRPADYYVWESNAFYYDRLLQDPEFKANVKAMWNSLDVRDAILQHIDEATSLLEKSQELNFKRWDIMNTRVSVGGIPMGSYEKEVEVDRQFFINHMNWLDGQIANY